MVEGCAWHAAGAAWRGRPGDGKRMEASALDRISMWEGMKEGSIDGREGGSASRVMSWVELHCRQQEV